VISDIYQVVKELRRCLK